MKAFLLFFGLICTSFVIGADRDCCIYETFDEEPCGRICVSEFNECPPVEGCVDVQRCPVDHCELCDENGCD